MKTLWNFFRSICDFVRNEFGSLIVAVIVITIFASFVAGLFKPTPKRTYYTPGPYDSKKDIDYVANDIEKDRYRLSDLAVVFEKQRLYTEVEFPKSLIRRLVIGGFLGETNSPAFNSTLHGACVDRGGFQMWFDKGYVCSSFPDARNVDELETAIIGYLLKIIKVLDEHDVDIRWHL